MFNIHFFKFAFPPLWSRIINPLKIAWLTWLDQWNVSRNAICPFLTKFWSHCVMLSLFSLTMTSTGSIGIEAEYWNTGAWSKMRLIWIDILIKKQTNICWYKPQKFWVYILWYASENTDWHDLFSVFLCFVFFSP